MGVSGSGKTTVGKLLAQRLNCQFEDADDFHSHENKAKMKAGIALCDEDRLPWLVDLEHLIKEYRDGHKSLVLACSALKDSYRTILSRSTADLVTVYLKADFKTIEKRLEVRHHQFMNPDLLRSQFETLEEPQNGIIIDASKSREAIVDDILAQVDDLS